MSETGRKDANIVWDRLICRWPGGLGEQKASFRFEFLIGDATSRFCASSNTGPDTITGFGTAKAVSVCLLTRALPWSPTQNVTTGFLRAEKSGGTQPGTNYGYKDPEFAACRVNVRLHRQLCSWSGLSYDVKELGIQINYTLTLVMMMSLMMKPGDCDA